MQTLLGHGKKQFQYQALDARTQYVVTVAENYAKDLLSAVSKVNDCLTNVRNTNSKCMDDYEHIESHSETLSKCEMELRHSALLLIGLIAKMKTKYIVG